VRLTIRATPGADTVITSPRGRFTMSGLTLEVETRGNQDQQEVGA
jgi:hypothetical protein